MVRKLSLAIALAIGIVPFGANALGLGDIHLKSALNQHFSGDINLLSVTADEIPDIKVRLASQDAFQRAGVDRPFLLTKLRFKPVAMDDGSFAVKVSSLEPIREPFLNFLIEVNWPKGKLVREYTVLLDPPVTLDRKPAPVKTVSAGTQQPVARQTAAPTQARTAAVAPKDLAWAGSGSSQPDSEPAVVEAEAAPGEYGPVQKNDTLWGVAKKTRHQDATMEQMMISLFQANPQAFIKNNINNLKTGQVLRVPSRDEVLGLTKREAQTVYREHLNEWRAGRKPAVMEESAIAQTESAQAVTGEVAEEAQAPRAELKIASARPEGSGAAGSGDSKDKEQVLDQLKQDLLASQEERQSVIREGEELRTRVDDLESQLEDLQRLLTLKNEQFAQLQAAVAGQVEAEEEVIATAEDAVEAVAETAAVAEPAPEEVEAEPKVTAQQPAVEPEPVVVPEPVVENAKPVAAPVAVEKPQVAAKPKEKSLIDKVLTDPTLLGVIVAVVVVLLALLWVIISRRKSGSSDFQESILISTLDDADSEQLPGDRVEPGSHSAEETSFLSDFSPSDIDALQDETGEVDPLAEADVYIAYGRYQQAEELIRQAIEKTPERSELKYKLFEILFATKDKAGFIELAESASVEGLDQKESVSWGKVMAMGSQLAAGHSLFTGAGESSLESEMVDERDSLKDELFPDQGVGLDEPTTDLVNNEDLDDLDLETLTDLGDLDQLPLDEDSIESDAIDDDSLELDLSELDTIADDADMDDLGLNLGDLGEIDQNAIGEESAGTGTVDGDSINLDIDLGDLGSAEEEADLDGLDFDLGDLGGEVVSADETVLTIEDTLESAEIGELEVDKDLTVADFGDDVRFELPEEDLQDELEGQAFNLDSDSTLATLGEDESASALDQITEVDSSLDHESDEVTDEVNTKMDLARAYIDMGDEEGARSILEEVLGEGNEGQQQEARELQEKLS
ncbi:MAG: FimV/HubP family polar landmark protein [Candidatus Sedimenticola sp. (ex Thyasira tokunagai)]